MRYSRTKTGTTLNHQQQHDQHQPITAPALPTVQTDQRHSVSHRHRPTYQQHQHSHCTPSGMAVEIKHNHMTYRIHYAKLNLQGDIPCLEFNSIDDLRSFIDSIVYPLKLVNEKIYLLAIDDEIIVTDNGLLVYEIFDGNINALDPFYEGVDIFIQEYSSYEEAYKVALDMREDHPLCYS